MREKNRMFAVESPKLPCGCCGKDLMTEPLENVIVQVSYDEDNNLRRCVPCHKGECDKTLREKIPKDLSDRWNTLSDFVNPYLRLQFETSLLHALKNGRKYSEQAAEGYKDVLIATAPFVFRHIHKEDIEEFNWRFPD